MYEIHIGQEAIGVTGVPVEDPPEDLCKEKGFSKSLKAGFQQVGNCIVDEALDIALEILEDENYNCFR